jgi:hypothetical protein
LSFKVSDYTLVNCNIEAPDYALVPPIVLHEVVQRPDSLTAALVLTSNWTGSIFPLS